MHKLDIPGCSDRLLVVPVPRGSEGSLTQDDVNTHTQSPPELDFQRSLSDDCLWLQVVDVFARNLEEAIEKKRAKLERLLGAPIDAVDAALRAKIVGSGKSLGGKKDEKLTKKHLLRLLTEVVAEAAAEAVAAKPPVADSAVPADGAPPLPPAEGVPAEAGAAAAPSAEEVSGSSFPVGMDQAMGLFHEIFQKEVRCSLDFSPFGLIILSRLD